jgi:hypothetical protein
MSGTSGPTVVRVVATRSRLVSAIGGGLAGTAVGALVAFAVLLVLDAFGITGSVEDEPLHGWVAFVAVVWLCPLSGLMAGTIVGWRRSRSEP